MTVQLRAPRPAVYAALTDPTALARWRFPGGMTSAVDVLDDGGFRVTLTYEAPDQQGKTTTHADVYRARFTRLVPDELVVEVLQVLGYFVHRLRQLLQLGADRPEEVLGHAALIERQVAAVEQAEGHVERLLRVVLTAEEPDLLGLLGADEARQQAGAEAAVERADLRACLPEARVVGGDREVADQMQDVAAADRVAGHHRDHRLGQAADLHLEVGDVEAADEVELVDLVALLVQSGDDRLTEPPGRSGDERPHGISTTFPVDCLLSTWSRAASAFASGNRPPTTGCTPNGAGSTPPPPTG